MTRRQKKSPPVGRPTGKAVFKILHSQKTNSPGSTRTNDPLINSQLLYRLSYWGRTSVFQGSPERRRPFSRLFAQMQEKNEGGCVFFDKGLAYIQRQCREFDTNLETGRRCSGALSTAMDRRDPGGTSARKTRSRDFGMDSRPNRYFSVLN